MSKKQRMRKRQVVSDARASRLYRDHECVSILGPGWNKTKQGETVCGICKVDFRYPASGPDKGKRVAIPWYV